MPRALLKAERIDYWLGVGALPSEKVAVLIKKYGTNGTHVDAQKAALAESRRRRSCPMPVPPPACRRRKRKKAAEAAASAESTTNDGASEPVAADATEGANGSEVS